MGVRAVSKGVSLLQHVNQRFEDFDRRLTEARTADAARVQLALSAAEKAVDKAEQAQALRNESQNEFRKSLGDLSALMWTTKEGTASVDGLRRELTIRDDGIEARLGVAERANATLQGRSIAFAGFGALIGSAAMAFIMKMFGA